ncbi:sugar diacid utilization regulator [Anaerosolibacter carboniphilus]|uniref:Sugar diacid utilization regulator n=1 Tax=Anaerosolibacter carboniphilus TaxID=1417629 RepID=A0A841KZ55_9FIRM|nr:PucR family transcriptional regulator [Anaerosolibacter carboniphilus]MBB6217598.1 sugar diacid utilization regulator [Anaerosolibacter carboniphilus]
MESIKSILRELMRGVLNKNIEDEGIFALEAKKRKLLPAYLMMIDTSGKYTEEVLEITSNYIDIQLQLIYEDHVLLLSREDAIEDLCKDIRTNIMTELLIDCTIAIGGTPERSEDLHIHYNHCLEIIALKRRFKLPASVYHYEKMDFYRVVADMNPELKESIYQKVFNRKFEEVLDHEMVTTVEEYFRNNLNLTDTAARLFIHRNTLLYRLDKIHRHSGYDLKNFSDCWLFQLAWIIRKEK